MVRAGGSTEDFPEDGFESVIVQMPNDVFDSVGAPTKVRRVPTEKVGFPVLKQVRILRVGRAPPTGDRIAREINVDAARLCFLDQLFMRNTRVCVRSCD